ncbi:unnamed protein product [Bemisia tabaci]|uniref:GTP-binding protein REM 1 n=1 Tax=Bemisia tabaci TaxID=7038 RepID=A0A9P0G4Q2_BEMTA|nr:unnamed protein product [Bemisia tabaci]
MTMTDEALLAAQREKGRSASICAPGISSMEVFLSGIPPPGTPPLDAAAAAGTGTPRRRRPATRSQSARLTGGKSVRRRALNAELAGSNQSMRSGGSEPRLEQASVTDSPSGFRRKGSARRVNSVYHGQQRKSTAFLDVPTNQSDDSPPDQDSYRLRSFSFTSKGIINRGDSFRRRSRSNSLLPKPDTGPPDKGAPSPPPDVVSYTVGLLGAQGVGKTSLISQFMTSECINAYDRQRDDGGEGEQSVSIMLNGEESELRFVKINKFKLETGKEQSLPHAWLIIYSVVDKASFQRAEDDLTRLQDSDLLRTRPTILVGNKIDLARSRAVSTQDGKCLACTFRAKFIEISVGINHNVDELLVGVLTQIRLKLENAGREGSSSAHWYKNRGVIRASMKARQMFTWIFGKEDSKFKNCENLQIL